ncbi:MAG: YggS family pyridoxal phosphate-dependent enzyme [Candidatus Brocadiaceae bacterium]|nr:YggS family pyridoxal phosphate-dependent enzyme [Candidatus Brocadiaceae bacterium]
MDAAENYGRIRRSLPEDVTIVVAAKARTAAEMADVLAAGARVIGHNYVQEAQAARAELGPTPGVEWHMIGHLQRNKAGRALETFDVFQSVDSLRLARVLNDRAKGPVRVCIEVNVGGESSKTGAPYDSVPDLIRSVAALPNLRIEGLMAMEPYCEDPEDARPYLRRVRGLFERLCGECPPGVRMDALSMGMTHSYRVAVEEGANMVRIGTAIFGPRRA